MGRTLSAGERGERGESRGGLSGATPESCLCRGWDKGYVQSGTAGEGTCLREGL